MDKTVGWLMVIYGAWSLVAGIITNDMGGLAALGYNPDLPLSFGRAPVRFLIGIAIYGALLYYGWKLITGQSKLRRED